MLAVIHRFPDRDDVGERDRKGDRHVHVGPAVLEGMPGRLVEEPPGIDERRRGDHRGNPVEEIARGRVRPRPHRHGQKHDIGSREAGDGDGADQFALQPVARILDRCEKMRVVSGRINNRLDEFDGVRSPAVGCLLPDDGYALRRQVDASTLDLAESPQRPFDRADAGAAMDPGHAEVGLPQTGVDDTAGQQQFLRGGQRMPQAIKFDSSFGARSAACRHCVSPAMETRSVWSRTRLPSCIALTSTIHVPSGMSCRAENRPFS